MNTIVTTGYNPMLPLLGRLLIAAIFLVAGIRKILIWGTSRAWAFPRRSSSPCWRSSSRSAARCC